MEGPCDGSCHAWEHRTGLTGAQATRKQLWGLPGSIQNYFVPEENVKILKKLTYKEVSAVELAVPLRVLRWRREKQSPEHLITRGGHTETPGGRSGWGDEPLLPPSGTGFVITLEGGSGNPDR